MMIQSNQESRKSSGLSQIPVRDDESRLNESQASIVLIRLRINGMTPTLSLIHFKAIPAGSQIPLPLEKQRIDPSHSCWSHRFKLQQNHSQHLQKI